MTHCSIDGCLGEIRSRGWCAKHYSRWNDHGDPMHPPGKHPTHGRTFEARLAASVQITGACWLWRGAINNNGYGTVWDSRSRVAHRWVYMNLVGEIPGGLELDHLCRVKSCVNPDHLEPVTSAENIRRSPLSRRKPKPWEGWWKTA